MKAFMDEEFLLTTPTAGRLFHDYAEPLPLIDYHCHISPEEIYRNRQFKTLDEVWLGGQNPDGSYAGDHYKWRMMRSQGIEEAYITGNKPGKERIRKFAEALDMAAGNPMVHWTNLELRRYFGITEPLTSDNAEKIYDACNEKLKTEDLRVRGIIRNSNVAFIGTTDDPTDDLGWHRRIRKEGEVTAKVCPSFRPDNAVNIHKPGFTGYLEKLAACTQRTGIETVKEVVSALSERLLFFKQEGCRAADHGLDYVPFRPASEEETDRILGKALKGEAVTAEEAEKYQTFLLLAMGKIYAREGIVMQIHYNCLRNPNARIFREIGPDAGCDTVRQNRCGPAIAGLLSALDLEGLCPRTILYSLNPADNEMLDAMTGSFQTAGIPGKIQHGAAWWFNDTKSGMEAQLRSLANLGLLGNFVGMLTDSRSFLSYTRHEYFRRIFCSFLGQLVENGEYPDNERILKKIVEGVCYKNAKDYFGI